jgi:ferredoxin-type protein NapH
MEGEDSHMKIRIRKLQVLRRTVQVAVILLVLAVPAVSRYANYLAAYELNDTLTRWDGTLQGETLAALDSAFRTLPGSETERVGQIVRHREGVLAHAQSLRGGPWSMQIAGLSLSDPLAALESVVARKHISKVVVISVIIPVVLTVLLGRIFCSWICPMGLLLEMTDKLRALLRFLEIRPRNVPFARSTKYAVLVAGILLAAIGSVPILGYIYPPAIMSREAHDLVFGMFDRAEAGQFGLSIAGLTWMSLIIVGIALVEVAFSRRWWCRYVCPGGAVYNMLGKARPVRVKLLASKCTNCADCVVACPMGLNPMKNEMGMECDNCGVCISHCDDDALAFKITMSDEEKTVTAPPDAMIAK